MAFLGKIRLFKNPSLQTRFILRVLLPPFLILALVMAVGFVVLSVVIRSSEVDSLQRVAATTAAKLDREFALRKTVLVSTGEQLFEIGDTYNADKKKLTSDYEACRKHLRTSIRFMDAPDAVCKPFYPQLAVAAQGSASMASAVDTAYTDKAKEMADTLPLDQDKHLKSYSKFFPETSLLQVVDTDGAIVGQATNGTTLLENYRKTLEEIAKKAHESAIEGVFVKNGVSRQIIFAYPIEQGAVIASYNLDNSSFLYPSWKAAPIDSTRAYVVVADTQSGVSYPNIKDGGLYKPALQASRTTFTSGGVDYLATSESVAGTSWKVIVSSPEAIALGSLANAQIIAVALAGLLLISFTWVGSRFVQRTVGSILGLVGGAVVFSSGHLTHRIDTSRMSDKEFSQLADTMNNMALKIQEAEEAIIQKDKEFINVATHEIKAPITAIIGNLSMTLEDGMGELDDTARQLTTQAYASTIRLRDLVNELLDLARLESGRAQFNLEPLDLATEITDMINLQRTPALEKKVTMHYEPPEEPVTVFVDKTKLQIILTNFISNGIKYNRSPGELAIAHSVRDAHVDIAISDTGLGIPQEQQARMFQKFFRVEASDRNGIPGTGLGMYITKQFIEGMGGTLRFVSEHGKGTTFYVTLPLATAENKNSSKQVGE